MNHYRIFVHEQGGIEAVKIGFSWPAFFFNSVWAAYKQMWGIASAVFFFAFLIGFISGFTRALMETDPSEGVTLLQWLADLTLGLITVYVGSKGNDWYAKKLLKRDFRFAVNIVAPDPDRAKIIFDKEYVYDDQTDVWYKFDGILA